jgi:hypothetical protein
MNREKSEKIMPWEIVYFIKILEAYTRVRQVVFASGFFIPYCYTGK